MGQVFRIIANRLASFSIKIEDYIYHDENGSTLKESATLLDGISFVAQNKLEPGGTPVVGIDGLKEAFDFAIGAGGKRAFAGQTRQEDLDHGLLQASFGATKGLGYREIFYLSQHPKLSRDPGVRSVWDQDGRAFDAKFGKMADAVDVTSLHAALLGPISPTALPKGKARGEFNHHKARSSIHLDDKGFVFSDIDGRIFLSSETCQHLVDELGLKTILIGAKSPVSFFLHTDSNSIGDPVLGFDTRHNAFLQKRAARGVLGLELATKSDGLQMFARGSLSVEARGFERPTATEVAGVVGVRGRF